MQIDRFNFSPHCKLSSKNAGSRSQLLDVHDDIVAASRDKRMLNGEHKNWLNWTSLLKKASTERVWRGLVRGKEALPRLRHTLLLFYHFIIILGLHNKQNIRLINDNYTYSPQRILTDSPGWKKFIEPITQKENRKKLNWSKYKSRLYSFSFFLINFKIENAGHNIQGITDHVQQIIVTE